MLLSRRWSTACWQHDEACSGPRTPSIAYGPPTQQAVAKYLSAECQISLRRGHIGEEQVSSPGSESQTAGSTATGLA